MGGNALKVAKVGRAEWHQYFNIWHAVESRMAGRGFSLRLIPAYGAKESFGDMDILVTGPMNTLIDVIEDEFSPTEIVNNGDCISFDVMGLQIDFIKTTPELLPFNLAYFSYNDLGNFMGRTAYRLGFKYGHDGLWYTLRDEENESRMVAEILVTRDPERAFNFLGYDYARWKARGFAELEDVFEFTASSEYFDPAQYLLSNRSNAARVRDRKRESYRKLLEWIRRKYPDLTETTPKTPVDRRAHFERALEVFPEFASRYRQRAEEWNVDQAFKRNFNGRIVSEMFDVEGKELGVMMRSLTDYFRKHNLTRWVGLLDGYSAKELIVTIAGIVSRGGGVDGS